MTIIQTLKSILIGTNLQKLYPISVNREVWAHPHPHPHLHALQVETLFRHAAWALIVGISGLMIIQLKRAGWPKTKAPFSDGFLHPITGQYWSLKVWPHFLSDHPSGRLSGGVCECILLPNIDLFSPPQISTEENSPVKILQEISLCIYLLGNSSLTCLPILIKPSGYSYTHSFSYQCVW